MASLLDPNPYDGRDPHEQERVRALSRSPHPYHHEGFELPHAYHRFHNAAPAQSPEAPGQRSPTSYPFFSKDSSHGSGSGTDADDEHFLKGLPAPRTKLHKGLRGRNELTSGTSTPLPSPSIRKADDGQIGGAEYLPAAPRKHREADSLRLRKTLARRATEVGIVVSLGVVVCSNHQVAPILQAWSRGYWLVAFIHCALLVLYPLRLIARSCRTGTSSALFPFKVPTTFDPAPLLYPSAISLLVPLLLSPHNELVLLPSLVLSVCCLPRQLVPELGTPKPYNPVHWTLSCLPLARFVWTASPPTSTGRTVSEETLVLLFPLNELLCAILRRLTNTSLLTAELELLSVGLINLLVTATSPQAQILAGLLWGGGLGILVFCSAVIRWEVTLARVPKWRFRRVDYAKRPSIWKQMSKISSWHRIKFDVPGPVLDSFDTAESTDGEDDVAFKRYSQLQVREPSLDSPPEADNSASSPIAGQKAAEHSRPTPGPSVPRRKVTHTPSGRRKRTTSLSVRPFLRLTQTEAAIRRWLYAGYVYAAILVIIFTGVRLHIGQNALGGAEPVGWALGYVLGDQSWFRYRVVKANMDRWACLPPRRAGQDGDKQCHLGWVQHIRRDDLGEANTRLLLSGYWAGIVVLGLAVVLRLKDTYEVDTRRKVFHVMMVGMFLPATYVDPAYAALALSLALAIFLVLDLVRASQLPPFSRPIALFLAPYVDGRDLRGPVVISHIFLLIGCAIPLWLALAGLPRGGSGHQSGWEIPTRDVSMVAGVVCVGLGDAAASLIGRRYGHRKWLWGGGKSLEGSVAFAVAVFVGLLSASVWLRIGRWPVAGGGTSLLTSARNAAVCSSMASLTEAVLTGGNDNVIVPVVLWTCVKGLGV